MKQICLMIAVVALVGCGKKAASEPQAKGNVTQKTDPEVAAKNPEPTKLSRVKLGVVAITEKVIAN